MLWLVIMGQSDLDKLRAQIWALERSTAAPVEALSLAPALDAALPWRGLPLACLHEIIAAPLDESASGFCTALLGRLSARGPILWCLLAEGNAEDLYSPGVAAFGLEPEKLILARAKDRKAALWVMEEALRSGCLGAVMAEISGIDLTASRRLQLAAEAGGVTGFVLHGQRGALPASAATTRWRVNAAPKGCWQVGLERCRGGRPMEWLVEWRDEARDFRVFAEFRDGSADTAQRRPRRLAG